MGAGGDAVVVSGGNNLVRGQGYYCGSGRSGQVWEGKLTGGGRGRLLDWDKGI